ncbi:hypothetical protein VNO77_42550 [Canavalia gladiata]|uniref:Uncharacterized protein n=1 Tax=Canavalia gladiata TaxID=3824 RepID=A0AAN9JSG8_CANGL
MVCWLGDTRDYVKSNALKPVHFQVWTSIVTHLDSFTFTLNISLLLMLSSIHQLSNCDTMGTPASRQGDTEQELKQGLSTFNPMSYELEPHNHTRHASP